MSRKYHEDLAKELGLEVIYSDRVDNLLAILNKEIDAREVSDSFDSTVADEVIVCDRDEGYLSAILHVLGVCAKNPGRKRWVLGFAETMGYSECHLFAVNSVQAANGKIRKKLVEVRKMKKAS
jgi:hypothetical protein